MSKNSAMRRRDLSLVFFTLLAQCSIGIVLWLMLLALITGQRPVSAETGLAPGNPVLLALLLVVLATTMSFLHLGNPRSAPRAIRNLATSWLSREILAIGLFTVCLLLAFLAGWRTGAAGFAGLLLLPAALAGLFLLWTMSGVYSIVTVPSWNSAHTPIGFTLATLSLGAVSCLLLAVAGTIEVEAFALDLCAATWLATLLLEAGTSLANQRRLEKMDTGFRGPAFRHGMLRGGFLARGGVLLLTALGIAVLLLQPGAVFAPDHSGWIYPLLILGVVQEFIGRILFYASYFRLGL